MHFRIVRIDVEGAPVACRCGVKLAEFLQRVSKRHFCIGEIRFQRKRRFERGARFAVPSRPGIGHAHVVMGQRVPAILRNRSSIGLQRSFDVAGRQQNIAAIHVRAYEIRRHPNGGVVTPQRVLELARVLNDIAFLDQA